MKCLTVRIVDHSRVERDRSALVLAAADVTVLGVHGTSASALAAICLPLPDVLLVSVRSAGRHAIECVQWLKQRHPALLMIILTGRECEVELIECLSVGAVGYLPHHTLPVTLRGHLRDVHAGGSPLSALMTRKLLQAFLCSRPPVAGGVELSRQESKVIGLLARGLRYKEVAVELGVGTATVRTYLERAYAKLGVTNRTEAVARFLQYRR